MSEPFSSANRRGTLVTRRIPPWPSGFASVADHIVPIDEGGSSTIENAQAACRACNAAKGYLRRIERAGPDGVGVPSAADLDGYTSGCASSQGGPHDLSKWGGPAECWGQPGHASRTGRERRVPLAFLARRYCSVAELVETVIDFLDALRPPGELHGDVVDLRVDDSREHCDSVADHDFEPWCVANPCVRDECHP